MKRAKFWMCQIVMVAIVGLALGSPALAHNDDDNGFDDYKWHKKFDKKWDKKMAKLSNKLSDKPVKYARKHDKLQKKYEKKLAKHYSKHPEFHPTGGVFTPPPAPETTSCVDTVQRVNGAFVTVCL